MIEHCCQSARHGHQRVAAGFVHGDPHVISR
jgi:hypothetical protein